MRLDHEFTVPAPVEEVWQALLDPERVAPCMPGATLTGVDGDEFTATMKVKLGPISMQYKGTGEFTDKDEAARRLVIKASGKDTRGAGTASADVAVTLTEEGGVTKGSVATDLTVTGRPAQFGRGMISEVGGRLLGDFSTCLGERLGTTQEPAGDRADEQAPSGTAQAGARAGDQAAGRSGGQARAGQSGQADQSGQASEASEAEPLNLVNVAVAPLLKRALPIIAALIIIAIIWAIRGGH